MSSRNNIIISYPCNQYSLFRATTLYCILSFIYLLNNTLRRDATRKCLVGFHFYSPGGRFRCYIIRTCHRPRFRILLRITINNRPGVIKRMRRKQKTTGHYFTACGIFFLISVYAHEEIVFSLRRGIVVVHADFRYPKCARDNIIRLK